jgi:hypothetical protein
VSVASRKAKLAGLIAHRHPDDPAISAARRELRAAVAERYLARLRDEDDLSPEQRASLAVTLLSPAGGSDAP